MNKDLIQLVSDLIEGMTTMSKAVANTTARVRALEAFSIQLITTISALPQLHPAVSQAVNDSFEHYRRISDQLGETVQAGADASALDTLNALQAAVKRPAV